MVVVVVVAVVIVVVIVAAVVAVAVAAATTYPPGRGVRTACSTLRFGNIGFAVSTRSCI